MKRVTLLLLLLLLPGALLAQSGGIELTPFGAYRWGGEIAASETDLFGFDVKVADGAGYGIILGLPLSRTLQLELMANRQSTELETGGGLFEPSLEVADVDVTYYHAGLLFEFPNRSYTTFFGLSGGASQLDLDVPGVANETRFSASIGGGAKFPLTRNLGLRLEGRGYWTPLDRDDDDDFCPGCDFEYEYDEDLLQGEVRLGLIFSF